MGCASSTSAPAAPAKPPVDAEDDASPRVIKPGRPSIVGPNMAPAAPPRAASNSPPRRNSAGRSAYGPLTEQQYISRLAHSGTTLEVNVPIGASGASFKAQYAWASQRGYYPDQPTKANQDAYCVHTQFGGKPDTHLFGVFDGHGEKGTPCSQFAAEQLPATLLSQPLLAVSPEAAHAHAFVETNRNLRASKVDDSLSGTTAITMLLQGASLTVANVGDSRACLAEESGRKLTAFNLSCDQTPFRADECARVRRAGARVLTLDQMEGLKNPKVDCWGDDEESDDGDPPRLWLPNGSYPGTAFTRSLGDAVAERIGVIAEPEVECIALSGASRFAVVASDGVFEFLPSQAVVDMIAGFDDPLEAALAVVAESYRLWLQYETRTDDITIIIVRFKGVAEAIAAAAAADAAEAARGLASPGAAGALGRPGSLGRPMSAGRPGSAGARARPGSAGTEDPRPVRRTVVRSKREAITASLAAMAEEPESEALPPPPAAGSPGSIGAADAASLATAVKACFLFAHLSDAQRAALATRFLARPVRAGDTIVAIGERADAFYVVASGDYDVYLTADASGAPHFTYSAVHGRTHPSFGELGLLYNQPRTATVKARTAGVLWTLSRPAFRSAMRRTDRRAVIATLRTVQVLDSLSAGQLQRLADLLQEASFKDGDVILKAGTAEAAGGDDPCFYIIEAGGVKCTAPGADAFSLGPAKTFGERALLSAGTPRPHTITATGATKCLRISRAAFEEVLGPLAHIIDADRRWRERAARHVADAAALPSLAALKQLTPADLGPPTALWRSDVGRVATCSVLSPGTAVRGGAVTLRQVAIAKAAAAGRQASVMRESAVSTLITPMPFIPAVVRTFADDTWLTAVLATTALGTLGSVFTAPLSERAAAHYVACATLAIEHVHMHGAVFRGLDPDTVLLDTDGHLQLADFRFAKQLLAGPAGAQGRTFTLCGHPEYLAPEVVTSAGHSEAADWWSLAVFAWWLVAHSTPFGGAEHTDEVAVYKAITQRAFTFPETFSKPFRALLDGLLTPDPDARPGADWVRAQPWFSACGVDWDQKSSVMTDEVPIPDEARAMVDAFKKHPPKVEDVAGVAPVDKGADKWWEGY